MAAKKRRRKKGTTTRRMRSSFTKQLPGGAVMSCTIGPRAKKRTTKKRATKKRAKKSAKKRRPRESSASFFRTQGMPGHKASCGCFACKASRKRVRRSLGGPSRSKRGTGEYWGG